MIQAFCEGLETAGHEYGVYDVCKMNIHGCLACEYCHGKGEGKCVQQDDMTQVIAAYQDADMVVYASPIYYFGMTSQIMAAMQRVYCIGKPPEAKKAALLISSGSPGTTNGAIATYKDMIGYLGMEDAGIFCLAGEENKAEDKLAAIKEMAKTM